MLQVEKILFPTDFSPTCDAAFAPACHWARRLGAQLHVFHALNSLRPDLYPADLGTLDPAVLSLSLQDHAQKEMAVRRRLATNQGANVTCATAQGLGVAPRILDYAEEQDIDLIITSTHGRRGFRRLLLGSVAEEVVQRSICPVLTIGAADESGFGLSPQRILVAVDLSAHSAAPVAHAKHLAALFGAEMLIVHVPVRVPTPTYYDGIGLPDLVFDSPLLEAEAQSALARLYESAPGPRGTVGIHLERGLPVEGILRFAQASSSDLIVVASHGLSGASHLLMGSVAEQVVRQSSCPVLTIKSFGKSLIRRETAARVAVEA